MSSQELCGKTQPGTAEAGASPQGHSIRADWCGLGPRMALVKAARCCKLGNTRNIYRSY